MQSSTQAPLPMRRFLASALSDFSPDVVIHSAASYADPNDWLSDVETNIIGAINLSKICSSQGIENILNFQTALCYGVPSTLQ